MSPIDTLRSKLIDKIGEAIASECLTLSNDPFVPGMPGSRQIDSEGCPSQKIDVIKEGRLMTYLYNLESARKAGVKSSGTGKRSYTGKAGTGFDNLFVAKGNRSRQEILNSLEKCLMVTKFEGAGIRSAVSGEISLGIQGYLYEKGNLVQPVDRVTISSNYFELLKDISEFSNEYSDAFSSTKISSTLILASDTHRRLNIADDSWEWNRTLIICPSSTSLSFIDFRASLVHRVRARTFVYNIGHSQ